MQISNVISTAFDSTKRLLVKVRRFGKSDIQTPYQSAPFGIDSNPIKGMKAVYSATSEAGKNVIIGYLNENQLSDTGETRIYSVDENGGLKTYIWVKKDGTIEIGDNSSFATKYTELKSGLDAMVNIINQNLPLIAAGIATAGGSYTPISVTLDISASKNTKVKM
jgi:hypothetical protein